MSITTPELDQILVPSEDDDYETWPLLTLFGLSSGALKSYRGFGHAPLHFITQRGPYQDGETVIDYRYDPRVVQIVIEESLASRTQFWDRRWKLLDLLRPNRSFGDTTREIIYRKWLPEGKRQSGSDLVTTNGSATVTSDTGRFVGYGLEEGDSFIIDGGADAGTYTVDDAPNDYTVELDSNLGADATGVNYHYRRGWGKRDLYCLLEQGPAFDEGDDEQYPFAGYREALRFVAHDPFWYGQEQSESWAVATYGALVFEDVAGVDVAWFGLTAGEGQWFFDATGLSETQDVIYWGTIGAKPVFQITGPAQDVSIRNNTVDAEINLDYAIPSGETVTVDTLALIVTNNFGDNLMPYTTGDLVTFVLAPAPQAPDRANEIQVSFTNGDANTEISMTWKVRDIGI